MEVSLPARRTVQQADGVFKISSSSSLNALICWMEYCHEPAGVPWPAPVRPVAPHAWPEAIMLLPAAIQAGLDGDSSQLSIEYSACLDGTCLSVQVQAA